MAVLGACGKLCSFIKNIYIEHLPCVRHWDREVNKADEVRAVVELAFGMGGGRAVAAMPWPSQPPECGLDLVTPF